MDDIFDVAADRNVIVEFTCDDRLTGMFARTQSTGAAGAFEMITGALRHRVEWHELLAAICEFMNHSVSDDLRTLDNCIHLAPLRKLIFEKFIIDGVISIKLKNFS